MVHDRDQIRVVEILEYVDKISNILGYLHSFDESCKKGKTPNLLSMVRECFDDWSNSVCNVSVEESLCTCVKRHLE